MRWGYIIILEEPLSLIDYILYRKLTKLTQKRSKSHKERKIDLKC